MRRTILAAASIALAMVLSIVSLYGCGTGRPSSAPALSTDQADPMVVTVRGAFAEDALAAMERRGGPRVVKLGLERGLLVPPDLRFKPVDGKLLAEAAAAYSGLTLVWLQRGKIGIIYRPAADAEVARLKADLGSSDVVKRRDAARMAGWIADIRTVRLLLTVVRDPDGEVRRQAARSVARLGVEAVVAQAGEDSLPFLELLAAHADMDVRKNAVLALAHLRGKKVVALLEKLAANRREWELQPIAALTLARIGNERGWQFLEELANDDYYGTRAEALLALGQVGGERALAMLEKLHGAGRCKYQHDAMAVALGQIGGGRALRLLGKLAADKDPEVRQAVAVSFARLGEDEKALALLEKLAVDPEPNVRWEVPKGLAQVGNRKALELLAKFASDQDDQMRWTTADALGQIGNEEALKLLEKLVADSAGSLHQWAIESLGRVGGDEALKRLAKLADDPEDSFGRAGVINALSEMGGETALAHLARLAGDRKDYVQRNVASALRRFTAQQAFPLLEKLAADQEAEVRKCAVLALGTIGGYRALEFVLNLAADKDHEVRIYAAHFLGELGGSKAVRALETLTADEGYYVPQTATEGLEKLKREEPPK